MNSLPRDLERWTNTPCPGCGCVCDDVSLTFDGERLASFEPHCELGERWFRDHAEATGAAAEINGREADYDDAIARAVELLQQADYPLIYGLSRSATPGQRAAVALADRLGAVIDTTASICHGPSIMAMQEVGEVTCTLGEIRNRADLVVFWGCHPAASHPRHAERYAVHPRGRFTRGGRAERTIVMVGAADQVERWKLDAAGTEPDLVIPIAPGRDFEALSILRSLLRDQDVPDVPDDLRQLMDLMRGCRYGVAFFGLGLAGTEMGDDAGRRSDVGHIHVAALLQLVADLNAVTRFTARRMRLQGDVSGADNVLCWQSGYPFGVDFSRGYPRFNPGEFTANELLQRGDADLCVLIGAETVPYFSFEARRHLESIPTILIDYPSVPVDFTPTVRFRTAVYGLHAAGTAYRMDNVPISLRGLLSSDLPTDERVLGDLLDGLRVDAAVRCAKPASRG